MTNLRHQRRGAALIVAILILAILLIIVLAFFQASRQEMHIATNYSNATQADLLAEGGTALAISFLNHDRAVHPTVTSSDHGWKTYFNNAWAVGKPALWKLDLATGTRPSIVRDPTGTNGNNVPVLDLSDDNVWDYTNHQSLPGDLLYIPRVDTAFPLEPNLLDDDADGTIDNELIAKPFAINYPFGPSPLAALAGNPEPQLGNVNYSPQQIHFFTDWDNDGDSLRDSAWIPMPKDKFPDFPNPDGIDNDLDGVVDEGPNGIDDDGDGLIDEADETAERALFAYWGGNDGLDNDGDGLIDGDDTDEARIFLTTSLGPVDMDENGVLDPLPNITLGYLDYSTDPPTPRNQTLNPNRVAGNADIDKLDNDFSLVINDIGSTMYRLPSLDPSTWTAEEQEQNRLDVARGYNSIDQTYIGIDPGTDTRRFTFLGEPVCELAGRVAVLIKDENSKVNTNAAGGRNFRDIESPFGPNVASSGGLRRALWSGASTSEYETRVLPRLGDAFTDRLWNMRMGAHAGIGFNSVGVYGNIVPGAASYTTAQYNFDVSLPGFGRVDDNANALWMSMDGIDNDGDGLVDEGLADLPHYDVSFPPLNIAPPDGVMSVDEAWTFEGIDEPQEYQSYRPYRNREPFGVTDVRFAESDSIDNSQAVETTDRPRDNSVDEIGELGDRYLRSSEQMKLVEQLDAGFFDRSRNFTAVNSTDLNTRFRRYNADGTPLNAAVVSGPKLDYNYAIAPQIAEAIMRDWGYVATLLNPTDPDVAGPITPEEIAGFALGLRREDTAIETPAPGVLMGSVSAGNAAPLSEYFPPDKALRAAQLAANIHDNRDTNLGRTSVTTTEQDTWWNDNLLGLNAPRGIAYTQAGVEAIRINEIMVRAVRRVEAEMNPADPKFNPNIFSADPAVPDFDMQVIPVTGGAWQGTSLGYIGDRAYTYTRFDANDPIDRTVEIAGEERPKFIQFRFAPSPGLPPMQPDPTDPSVYTDPRMGARYYLTVNTQRFNLATQRLETTVTADTGLRYIFKYGTANQSIIDDVNAGFDPSTVVTGTPIVGYRNMANPAPGTETGWTFLPGDQTPVPLAGPSGGFYNVDEAYTVHIPPYNLVDPTQQMYLYVAVWFGSTDPPAVDDGDPGTDMRELAVNFFDFSQEPDHEWMELVNTAENGAPVNLSGWQVSVGAELMFREDGTRLGPTLLTIPAGTIIAPGGSILLGFNKYDFGRENFTAAPTPLLPENPLLRNGIGLARAENIAAASLMYATEPPIPGFDRVAELYLGESMFRRAPGPGAAREDYDFLDTDGTGTYDGDLTVAGAFNFDGDGNGTVDTNNVEAGLQSSTDTVSAALFAPNANPNVANKAWDRIVEVDTTAITSVSDLGQLAALVLNGGIFPNYPEHDGVDNDGDNLTLATDNVDNDGDGFVDEGINAPDGFDNDLDGFIDEGDDAVDGVDNNGDGTIDDLFERNDLIDGRSEGIDEGRWEYSAVLPVPSPFYRRNLNAPGSYGVGAIPYTYVERPNPPTTVTPTVVSRDDTSRPGILYTGSATDPPEWKAFAERRWFTPDSVTVTLYVGPKANNRVADSISYSERDVINRAVDDLVSVDVDADTVVDRIPLNPNCLSFWPDNTMGIDFYRSIERKHPLYNGDLYGISNRWQATDGTYDDWSPSTSFWERDLTTALVTSRLADLRFNHAFSGSPLRMNLAQRYMENTSNQFGANAATGRRWAFDTARRAMQNRRYSSPGDLLTLPSFMDTRTITPQPLAPAVAVNFDDVPVNYADTGVRQDITPRGVMLGQHPYDNIEGRDDMAAVMTGAAMDPLVLPAGTANFYSIFPQPVDWGQWNGTLARIPGTSEVPVSWAPVFLFPLNGDNLAAFPLDPNSGVAYAATPSAAPLSSYYLFTGPYGGAITNDTAFPAALGADLGARWPLKLRSTMYVSGNPSGFNPAGDHALEPAATALFEWDGADGLENGDYDVYIMMSDNLAPVLAADARAGNDYLTDFGRNLLGAAVNQPPQDTVVDIEMFTDRSYTGSTGNLEPLGPNGRCWIDDPRGTANYPEVDLTASPIINEFERAGNALNPQGDSFGQLLSRSPDDDGIIYYGTVRVENNYLALLLRNWTDDGKLAQFSRVVLTPRPRTQGRLNINTVESAIGDYYGTGTPDPDTQDINADGHADGEFNPLVGTPGMLVAHNPASPVPFSYFAEGNIAPLVADYVQALGLSDNVVANRSRINIEGGVTYIIRDHLDGRYYENPSDLIVWHPNELPNGDVMNGYPNFISANPTASPEVIFEEIVGRYSRLANLLTTRSDVFEIIVTAQTGYVSNEDMNDDGRLDYRNDFIVTGEKKIRTVYER